MKIETEVHNSKNRPVRSPGVRVLDGAFWGMLAEGFMFPTGLLVFIFLSRSLGPEKYGIYILAINFVVFLEWLIASFFDRATIKLTNEADHWEPLGAAVLQLQLVISLLATICLEIAAPLLARMLHEPALTGALRLLAVDIPLASLAHTHKYLLLGVGNFRQRAFSIMGRWLGKMVLVLLFVTLGFSIKGALWANVGASLIELLISRNYIQPAFFRRWSISFRRLLIHAAPLFLLAVSLRLYNKMDLFLLKYWGGTTIQAGLYSAAQNLALPLSVISAALNPVLLGMLSRECHQGNHIKAQQISRTVLRLFFMVFPFLQVASFSASLWVPLVLGIQYQEAVTPFTALLFSAALMVLVSLCMTLLIVAGKTNWTLWLIAVLIPPALLGYWLTIPRWGMWGAALVNFLIAFLTAMIASGMVFSLWKAAFPLGSLMRTLLLIIITAIPFVWAPAQVIPMVYRAFLVVLFIPTYYLFWGEFRKSDVLFLLEWLKRKS
jgi:O-antigen/teichoic acid export membrane protein